jgi:hypothetical protein
LRNAHILAGRADTRWVDPQSDFTPFQFHATSLTNYSLQIASHHVACIL